VLFIKSGWYKHHQHLDTGATIVWTAGKLASSLIKIYQFRRASRDQHDRVCVTRHYNLLTFQKSLLVVIVFMKVTTLPLTTDLSAKVGDRPQF